MLKLCEDCNYPFKTVTGQAQFCKRCLKRRREEKRELKKRQALVNFYKDKEKKNEEN